VDGQYSDKMAAEQEPVRPLKRLRYDALDSTMGDGHRRDPAHALQLTALPDLVLDQIISYLPPLLFLSLQCIYFIYLLPRSGLE
jgi:hypothetical protein